MHSRNSTRSLPALSATMSRRAVLRTMAGAGVAAMTITASSRTAGAQVSTEQHTSQLYATTDYLNLRSGPGTRHSVITVMPPKSIITLNAQEQNGYYSVTYDGRSGWAHRDYLVPAGLASEDPVIIGSARTTDDLNLRSGPGAGHQILRVAAAGTWVEASDTVRNGFRYVVHEGLAGWMADRYLSWATDGGQPAWYLTTTADLNLRENPSTSARIYLVIPEGSDVRAGDVVANGFRQVTYKGTTGWAHTGFLT